MVKTMMQQVSPETELVLNNIFSHLLELDRESLGEHGYNSFVISCYSHWLSEEEADRAILSYATLKPGDIKMVEYLEIEKGYLAFYQEFWRYYPIFLSFNENISNFFQLPSLARYKNICKNSLREKRFVNICLPQRGIALLGCYDLSILCYYPMSEDMEDLKKIVSNNNLFILP